jgi:hypothetical protein
VRKVLYRVGDVVRGETAAPGTDRKGIVIGWVWREKYPPWPFLLSAWLASMVTLRENIGRFSLVQDYYAHGPPEWLNSIDASLHDVPHYRYGQHRNEPLTALPMGATHVARFRIDAQTAALLDRISIHMALNSPLYFPWRNYES